MSSADAAIGMMDGAYFVGRKELLDFFNNLLDLSLSKIEQTAPGAIACQVTDMIFPNCIPMARVNWEARSDYEYVQNYKLLQAAFSKHRVQRHVDVDKLIRAKYQDNLEFCQWLKAFYDQAAALAPENYDPVAVRSKGKGGRKFNQQHMSGKGRNGKYMASSTTISTAPGASASNTASNPLDTRASRPLRERMTSNGNNKKGPSEKEAELEHLNSELTQKVQELEMSIEEIEKERDQIVTDVEKERDFYFSKLRSIEVMLQVHQEKSAEEQEEFTVLTDKVFQILYAAAEDNLTVNAEGQVVEQVDEELNELLVDTV
mmetsp:Transcript_12294/g.16095  ORF Transcript_12294/g.16095 Transcript_12294/m.16095 type:complete len:317 (-) Transcript_12294:157-1107(-)|eukprot:CAMPEP_0198142300 /NCGR_PEP_ID=MMETSP1443-20131203/5119_1 /TAXON_ID=186043 /ORGANISM="Entomoneis sp., Strain CCMP2396" /LENGTH=316 /DNA_ID=CAMNT_0043805271 /DNA_START=238 /DNA_END=1188 /DNA_ORIENTATION=-